MSSKKGDKPIEERQPAEDSAPESPAAKSVRTVVVTHLDAPPPSGKKTIHPRRPAPIVPTHEERTGEQVSEDTDEEKQSSE